ncbi:MAG TPA: tetratricopeptide repeat protein [Pyrinomonadaceae bacterium]|nr:tetratricopeptide repeat protein [Pyrinomonadaceae bacterium]
MSHDSIRRLGRYEISSLLGRGGMGEVYLAHDTQLNRPAALKIISPGFVRDENQLRRFRQEALATSALNHPNIITIYEIGSEGAVEFIATEFIEGVSLRERLVRGALELHEVLEIGSQIASALAAAHDAGIVHRDIKPDNIMIRRDGYVKVLDFGIAKLNEKHLGRTSNGPQAATKVMIETTPGVIMGTVAYMSPEQARGLAVETSTDIWSTGVVLYEMLTGHLPFEGKTMSDVIVSILEREPPPLTQYAPGIPDQALQRIFDKALHKQTDERYRTIDEMLDDLKTLKRDCDFQAKLKNVEKSDLQVSSTEVDTCRIKSAVIHPHNLPAPITPLVGRTIEANTIKKLFRQQNARLITLTGPGGTGKTRLGLGVAAQMLGNFEDGVFLVNLAPITDADLVASAIAKTLNVKESAERPLIDSLKEGLREKCMLLLLDNFEQTLDAAPLVVELLTACPRLKILVTSRAVLHVTGEYQFPVPPLSLPNSKSVPPVKVVERYSAVALFSQRARAIKPDFAITESNIGTVIEICRRLEGLPLAIELAAARIKLFPPKAMLALLNDRLQLLTGGARDLPERQQTMRSAIAWSYDLLEEQEKKLFRRLSIFVDGCTSEAAEAVCNGSSDLKLDVLEGLASLVDKSLQRQEEYFGGEPRFRAFETIREYGRECLSKSGEESAIRRQHANFFLKFVEQIEPELLGSNQELWLDRLEAEHENLRAALKWCAEAREVDIGLRLAGALWRFWSTRGFLVEGREQLTRLLTLCTVLPPSKAMRKALYAAGVLAESQGDYPAARSYFEKNLSIHRDSGDKWGVANSLNNLGIIAFRNNEYVTARSLYEESLSLWRELGNQRAVALSLINLGNIAEKLDNHLRATSLYQESLALFRELKDVHGIASALGHLADAARRDEDYQSARTLYEESLAMFMESGSKWHIANVLADLGELARERGDCIRAQSLYQESMVIFGELGDIRGLARLFEAFMALAIGQNRPERALRLASAADAVRKEYGVPLSPDQETELKASLQSIKRSLSESTQASAWSSGASMPIERAIEYALGLDAAG